MKIFESYYIFSACFLLYFWFTGPISAQQQPHYTQYMYNTMTLNPAYAGSTGSLQANILYRNQWVGVEGAPTTQSFSLHSPLRNEKVGLGLSIINDQIGPSNEFLMNGNFSYTLQTGRYTSLALGINGGARILNIDWDKGQFYDPVDPLLNNNIHNKLLPLIGAGAYFYSDKWYAGISVPNFIRSEYYNDMEEAVLSDRLHYFVMGGYVFDISRSVLFKPAFLAKIVSGAPLSLDISANFLIEEMITLGASYRWNDAISGIAGFQIFESLFVGYSYDYTVTDFRKYNDGTHEIILKYDLRNRNARVKSPRFF